VTYSLQFTPKAAKQIAKLDTHNARRIRRFLESLDLDRPRSSGRALSGDSGLWRYRVGKFRILVNIDDEMLVVLTVEVGHRRGVYRSL
jgi:mRNA interferase RelE/StbE